MFNNLSLIFQLEINNDAVNTFIISESNNIISVSTDKSITIFDIFGHILQKIENAHDNIIFDISKKDENNFATCSGDKSIKTWIKSENNKYILNKSINNIHDNDIHKIIYLEDNSIISCSKDEKIKILNLIDNEYKCHLILDNKSPVFSILFLKDENILVSAGTMEMNIWDLNNIIKPLITNINAKCYGKNALQRIDKERIVVGGLYEIPIISIKEKKIIKEIESNFLIWAICVIEKKNLFLCGGVSNNILIINNINYEKINLDENCHKKFLRGISLLNNGNIVSGSEDKKTKIWKLINDKKE